MAAKKLSTAKIAPAIPVNVLDAAAICLRASTKLARISHNLT